MRARGGIASARSSSHFDAARGLPAAFASVVLLTSVSADQPAPPGTQAEDDTGDPARSRRHRLAWTSVPARPRERAWHPCWSVITGRGSRRAAMLVAWAHATEPNAGYRASRTGRMVSRSKAATSSWRTIMPTCFSLRFCRERSTSDRARRGRLSSAMARTGLQCDCAGITVLGLDGAWSRTFRKRPSRVIIKARACSAQLHRKDVSRTGCAGAHTLGGQE